jgi:hypothetical protein
MSCTQEDSIVFTPLPTDEKYKQNYKLQKIEFILKSVIETHSICVLKSLWTTDWLLDLIITRLVPSNAIEFN